MNRQSDGRGPAVVARLRAAYIAGNLTDVCDAIRADRGNHNDNELLELIDRVMLGSGANQRVRACSVCACPLPPSRKAGRPRLRCPDCGGAPWRAIRKTDIILV